MSWQSIVVDIFTYSLLIYAVLLFGFYKTDAFPTDVWVKRVMQTLYFNGEEKKNTEIMEFALEKFKNYGGYAQQYLFYYAREKGIGKAPQKD